MPPRFDPDAATVELSVADLLDSRQQRSLGFAQRGGFERLWLGQAIHRTYQQEVAAADASYRSEVPVAATVVHRGWEATIRGRIDGLRRAGDEAAIVEEVKSVRRGDLAPGVREIYERQAALYAWMLSLSGETSVRAELVLIEIGRGEVDRVEIELDLEVVGRLVHRRLAALIREFESGRAAAERRRQAGKALSFPYSDLRPGQDLIIERVAAALETRQHLLLEAPTGLGKTVAALFPVLRYALENEKRVFVLTAKTLQQEMATTVLALLNPGADFHSLRLRAKAKMCANGEVVCHEDFCRFAKDYFLKLHRSDLVTQLLGAGGTLTPDDVYGAAEQTEVCPFEVSLELTNRVQVVVCDYNYAFDPYVALHHFGADSDLDDVILVIDEIHNLVDRGRAYFSPELVASEAEVAAAAILAGRHPERRAIAAVCAALERLVTRVVSDTLRTADGSPTAAVTTLPEDEFWGLRTDFDEAFVAYLEFQRESASYHADDPFVDLYFRYLRFLDGLALADDETFSQYVESEGEESRVKILCLDPSRHLGKVLNRSHAAVGLSATLSPPDFYLELLGLDRERAAVERVPSPFPAENRLLLINDDVSTLYRERAANYRPIADDIGSLAAEVPGNTLVLFPSYRFLSSVAELLAVPGKRVLVQSQGDTDGKREELLDALRSPLAGDVVLLAVAGGVFSEGVDYPGEMLRAVVVVGPCLPAVSLERHLLREYYQERFERGFEYAFVVPGMTRVIQAAGRLIRSADDTGILMLMDRRFLQRPYRDHIPSGWVDAGSLESHIAPAAGTARRFFSGLGADTVR